MDYSVERKRLQDLGEVPSWYTTAGYQLFMQKYSWQEETPLSRYTSVAKAMAQHAPDVYPYWWDSDPYTKGKTWFKAFFDSLWDGFISPSTPMLGNAGLRQRGTTVACAGGNVANNLYDRYNSVTEAGILTKHAHGTSYNLDEFPCEGAPLKRGGRSKGIMPIINDFITCMNEVTQSNRRGSLAYSLSPDHGDFWKVADNLRHNPEANNVGWLIRDGFVSRLFDKEQEALSKYQRMLGVKLPTGKGYFTFIDKMNRHLAEAFKRKGMTTKASNLCVEVNLPSDDEYTFSCVILNYNLEKYREFPEHLIQLGQIMSDCNISEYLATIDEATPQDKRALGKIKRFTEEFRALGSGVLGLHTLFQQEMIAVGSMESFWLNEEIFKRLDKDSREATGWLAKVLGEPLGCVGLGIRNATRLMMPPTKSTADIMGGQSEGIGLDIAMVFTKQGAGGEYFRVNKVLLNIMKERGVYNDATVRQIIEHKGSVQRVDWLTPQEKKVFLTAFEIDMKWVLELAAQRQRYIDQAQSINLYFTSNDTEEYIGRIHQMAFENEEILTLYYVYSMRGAGGLVREIDSCEMCQ